MHLHDILKQAVDPINTIGNAKYPSRSQNLYPVDPAEGRPIRQSGGRGTTLGHILNGCGARIVDVG